MRFRIFSYWSLLDYQIRRKEAHFLVESRNSHMQSIIHDRLFSLGEIIQETQFQVVSRRQGKVYDHSSSAGQCCRLTTAAFCLSIQYGILLKSSYMLFIIHHRINSTCSSLRSGSKNRMRSQSEHVTWMLRQETQEIPGQSFYRNNAKHLVTLQSHHKRLYQTWQPPDVCVDRCHLAWHTSQSHR